MANNQKQSWFEEINPFSEDQKSKSNQRGSRGKKGGKSSKKSSGRKSAA